MKWLLASVIALSAVGFAQEASACPVAKFPWEQVECETTAPRPSRDGSDPFSWSVASHDQRREYLVKSHVPYELADKLAVGGIPLQGQQRSSDLGWFLVPSVAPRAVFVFD